MTKPIGLTIRPLGPGDWTEIDRIQRECFSETVIEPRAVLQSIAALSPGTCLVAGDEEIQGYALAYPWTSEDLPPIQTGLRQLPPDARALFIHDVAVARSGRGRQIARHLVEHLLVWARAAGLRSGSLIAVQDSQTFWRRFGFSERADLTARFHHPVSAHYRVPFAFMTADLTTPD